MSVGITKNNTKAYLFLTFAALFWSGNFIVGKAASIYEIPPFSLNLYRWLFAFILLFPFTYKELVANKKYIFDNLGFFIILGILFFIDDFGKGYTYLATDLFNIIPVAIKFDNNASGANAERGISNKPSPLPLNIDADKLPLTPREPLNSVLISFLVVSSTLKILGSPEPDL